MHVLSPVTDKCKKVPDPEIKPENSRTQGETRYQANPACINKNDCNNFHHKEKNLKESRACRLNFRLGVYITFFMLNSAEHEIKLLINTEIAKINGILRSE